MSTYIVWVGGVELDHYMTKEAANMALAIWQQRGYSDVAIEEEKAMPEHDCVNSAWRWLDCAECKEAGETCQMQVCVDCGAEVNNA